MTKTVFLGGKRNKKRYFSLVKDKDGTRKTKSSAFKGERAPFKPVVLWAAFYYTEGEKKWTGGDDQWL